MDTIKEGRYEDTNKMFEKPDGSTFINARISAEEWWTEEKCEEWAKLLAVDIKDHEFQPKQPTTQMLGRFQPFHDGHKELFK